MTLNVVPSVCTERYFLQQRRRGGGGGGGGGGVAHYLRGKMFTRVV